MRLLKRFIVLLTSLTAAFSLSMAAYAQSDGFYNENELALPVKAPYDTKYTNIQWSTSEADTAGVPVPFGEYVFMPSGNKIRKLSEKDGSILYTAELSEKVSETCSGAACGEVLIQPARTRIFALNADNLEIKCSRTFGEICTDAAICDGLAYFGAKTDDGYAFYCADIEKELSTVWEYRCESAPSSPALHRDHVVFSAGKTLVCHEKSTDGFTENDIDADMVGAPFVSEYAVFVSTADGGVIKLRLMDSGEVEDGTITRCDTAKGLTSPVVWNGRVYVSSDEGLFILDSLNMTVEQQFKEIKNGTAPLVCYGAGPRVYVTAKLSDYWCLYSINDHEELDEPKISQLAKLQNFEEGRTAVSDMGTMYFRDGIGRLFALTIAPYNVFLMILKLVLLLALIVMVFLLLRYWVKQRAQKRPPEY